MTFLDQAIDLLGGQSALARACGVTQACIWKAKLVLDERGTEVSPKLARLIEGATGGEIKRWQLAPSTFDPPAASARRKRRSA